MLTYNKRQIVIMLYATRKPFSLSSTNSNGFYPAYLTYEYGIRDPFNLHMDLMADGYYKNASPEDVLKRLPVSDLKKIIEGRGKKAGTKDVLIKRILNSFSKEELQEILPDDFYVLSQEGRTILANNDDFILLHENPNWLISYDEYQESKRDCPDNFSFRDVIWRMVNTRIADSNPYMDYNSICNDYRILADVSLKLDNSEQMAVSFTMATILFEMCLGANAIDQDVILQAPLPEDAPDLICFPPAGIKFLKDRTSLLSRLRFSKVIKPYAYKKVFSESDFNLLVQDLCSQNQFDFDKWISLCNDRTRIYLSKLKKAQRA